MKIIVRLLCLCFIVACSHVDGNDTAKVGICFTGQGVKISGVANDFIEHVPSVAKRYEQVKKITNISDNDLLSGDDASLFRQGKAQQALVSVQCLIWEGISSQHSDLHFDYALGQSLGNYSALFAGGAITFENLLKFIQLRDKLTAKMSSSSDQPFGMLVVQGIDLSTVKKYVNNETTFVAGLNTASCFTISGLDSEINLLESKLKTDKPDVKLIKLSIAAPFHTNFMEPLVGGLWDNFSVNQNLVIPVISDATGLIYNSVSSFDKNWMKSQLTCPMRWSGNGGVCEKIKQLGLTHLIVVGDGQGLFNMLKENVPNINVYVVNTVKQLEDAVKEIKSFRKN